MSMIFKSYRKESRTDWGVTVTENTKPDRDQLHLGCMMRIADATEVMAQNFIQLQNQLKWANERNQRLVAQNEKLQRQVNAYKGVVKKLKNKS
jgi:alanine dehydrogenase